MGILAAMLVGALLGLLLAFLVIYLRVDQTVAGLSINILAIGFNEFYVRMANASNIPVQIELLPNMDIPLLAGVPIIGEIFFQQKFLTYLAFILVPVIADIDGSGGPEIGVVGTCEQDFECFWGIDVNESNFQMSVIWKEIIEDQTLGGGNSAFDFEGDGPFEVLQNDEQWVNIYSGLAHNV